MRRRRLKTADHAQVKRPCVNLSCAGEFCLLFILTFLAGNRTKAGEEGEVSAVEWDQGCIIVQSVYLWLLPYHGCMLVACVLNINSILAIEK